MSDPQGSKPGRGRSAAVAYGLGLALSCVVLLATCLVSQSTNQAAEPDDSRRKKVRSYAIGFGPHLRGLRVGALANLRLDDHPSRRPRAGARADISALFVSSCTSVSENRRATIFS